MYSRAALAAVALALAACGRSATQAASGPTATPQPSVAAQPAAAHQHGPLAAAAAAPTMQDTGDAMVRHNRHYLVSADSLAAQLASGRIVVVHVGRTDSAYLAGHIPGARFLPLSAVATTAGGMSNEFPAPEAMANSFTSLVIRPEQRIVIYGDDAGLFAARFWVALDLMGQSERAALLDGGLAAWRAGGRQADTGPVAVPRIYIPFTYTWHPEKLVDAAWVRARLGDSTVVLVDTRPADQFAGADVPCLPGQACVPILEARRGHIPGARNLFWMDALVSRANPVLKPMHALHHELWQSTGADAPHVRTVVTYCRSGFQASHAYFTARYVGYRDVRLYDGSFLEWAGLSAEQYPVSRDDGTLQRR
jgi:thiosulfate/3-mercaptopyruvate sulfurtransferase